MNIYKVSYGVGKIRFFNSESLEEAIKFSEKIINLNTYHNYYTLYELIDNNFNKVFYRLAGNPKMSLNFDKTREEHIAEFWHSFYDSIQQAKGCVGSHPPNMTLVEVAEVLAQNNIRFVYRR